MSNLKLKKPSLRRKNIEVTLCGDVETIEHVHRPRRTPFSRVRLRVLLDRAAGRKRVRPKYAMHTLIFADDAVFHLKALDVHFVGDAAFHLKTLNVQCGTSLEVTGTPTTRVVGSDDGDYKEEVIRVMRWSLLSRLRNVSNDDDCQEASYA